MMATPVAVAMVWLFMFEPTAGVINFVLKALNLPTSLWIAGSKTVIPALALVDIWEWTPLVTLMTMVGPRFTSSTTNLKRQELMELPLFQTIRLITLPNVNADH